MDIDAQIADTIGLLDRFHDTADSDSDRIRALSAKLRYLEQRRYHGRLSVQTDERQQVMETHLRDIADGLKALLARHEEPPNHTVMETRALGVKLRLVGRNGDPLLDEVARALVPTIEGLAAQQCQRVKDDTEQENLDRAVDRKLRLDKGTDPDAPSHD